MAFTKYKNRRGLAADWVFHNPVLEDGELGYEKDTGLHKIGNGTATWTSLPYAKVKALDVIFTPAGMVQAVNAQAAIEELWNEKSATTHTHGASGSQSTVGAGLPGLVNRSNGDLHYDTVAKKEYVHTGSLGAGFADTFDRADSTTIGASSSGATYTVIGTSPVIGGNAAKRGGASFSGVLTPIGTGPMVFSYEFTPQQATGDVLVVTAFTTAAQGSPSGYVQTNFDANIAMSAGYNGGSQGSMTRTVGNAIPTVLGRKYKLDGSMNAVTGLFTCVVTDTVTNASATFSSERGASSVAGAHAGFTFGSTTSSNSTLDNFSASATGTLAWESTDEYVATHTHATTGSKTTNGVGLPSFSGRSAGDQHYDTTAKKEYTLTGVIGGGGTDPFSIAGRLAAFVSNGTTYTWTRTGGNPDAQSDGSRVVQTGGGGFYTNPIFVLAGANTSGIEVAITVNKGSEFGVTARDTYISWIQGNTLRINKRAGSQFASPGTGIVGTFDLTTSSAWQALANATPVRVVLTVNGSLITGSVTSLDSSVIYGTISYSDPSPVISGENSDTVGLTYTQPNSADNFTFQSLGTLAWTEMVGLTSTSRSGLASLNTIGSGLPTLLSRFNGDIHFSLDIGRAFVHTGTAGSAEIIEAFDGAANAPLNGTTTDTGGFTWSASGALQFNGSGQLKHNQDLGFVRYGGFNLGATNQTASITQTSQSGSYRVTEVWIHANGVGSETTPPSEGYYAFFQGTVLRLYRRSGGNSTELGSGYTHGLNANVTPNVTVGITAVDGQITVTLNGVTRLTHTDPTPLTGTRVAIGIESTNNAPSVWDNYSAAALGTLKWEASEPVYLQAQLASGNVATGTNVLKPGLRVPAASTLKEVVLRCETAPVGASITVAVERFNNGVSAGVIATTSIPTGETVGSSVNLTGGCAKGDILKFNITSVGSTTAGSDLTISLDLR